MNEHQFNLKPRTFTTTSKKPGAEVVGSLPPDEEDEEDRGGRVIEEDLEYVEYTDSEEEDGDLYSGLEKLRRQISRGKLSKSAKPGRSKARKVVELLRKLLTE